MMSMSPADVTAEIHGFSYPDATPVPWSVGLDHVIAAETFWLSTVRSDGRPHVTPLIAVWHGDGIWFTTGPDEQKVRNLAANPACILTAGRSELVDGGFDVVLEGMAEQVTSEATLQAIAEAFAAKYGTELWDFVVRDGGFAHRGSDGLVLVFCVRPVRGLGFRKGDTYSQTTWRFPR